MWINSVALNVDYSVKTLLPTCVFMLKYTTYNSK